MTTIQAIAFAAGTLLGYLAMEIRATIQDERRYNQAVLAEARWIYQHSPRLARHYLRAADRIARSR